MYKKQPLSEQNRKVFYGKQQFSPNLWREVAIKLKDNREGNLRELELLAKLRHPNIVIMIDAGEYHGDVFDCIYIVMELFAQNLRSYVDENPFNFQKAFSFSTKY